MFNNSNPHQWLNFTTKQTSMSLTNYIGSKLVLKELPELKFGLPNVTVGNEYLIVDVEGSNFWLIDDDGQKISFNYTRFVI